MKWVVLALSLFSLSALARPAPIYGLVAMGKTNWITSNQVPQNGLEEPLAHPGVYSGAVCDLRWTDLQPTQGGAIVTTNIDACISTWQSYNATYPTTPLALKLRIYGGRQAPAWAQDLDGGPLTVQESGPYTVGYWWTTDYRNAWASFISAVAAIYNGNPLIQEVAICSCTGGNGGEPFILPAGPTDLTALQSAGYTDAQGEACLDNAWNDYSAWTAVALDYDFDSFESVDSGKMAYVPSFTGKVMQDFRTAVPGGTLANHSVQVPLQNNSSYAIYPYFLMFGSPVEFQTGGQPQCTMDTYNLALSYYMTEFEIWDTNDAGGSCPYTYSQLQGMALMMNLKLTRGAVSVRR